MRTAVMRRMASLVLAMVWAVARVAQPLQPACPHHAVGEVTAAVSHQHDGAHQAHAGAHGEPSTPDTPEQSAPACECAAHCCAAAAVSVPQSAAIESVLVSVAAAPTIDGAPTNPAVRPWSHWQPPSTAPPTGHTA
ncbi:hypothetical protein [Gemmatimonas sp.]|uniref:hypothetical protein n=1 Tax=Gemmatimonas sp. TaxID=1962908 RepID=UPI003340EDFD